MQLWTVFVLATSALMIWSSKICLTDAVLLLCTTCALLCIYLLWCRTKYMASLWHFSARGMPSVAGLMVKGSVHPWRTCLDIGRALAVPQIWFYGGSRTPPD